MQFVYFHTNAWRRKRPFSIPILERISISRRDFSEERKSRFSISKVRSRLQAMVSDRDNRAAAAAAVGPSDGPRGRTAGAIVRDIS